MKLLFFLLASVLFVILSPGVVFRFLKKSSKTTQMVVHTLIFAFSLIVLSKLIYYFFDENIEEYFTTNKGIGIEDCGDYKLVGPTSGFEDNLSMDESKKNIIGHNRGRTLMKNIIVITLQNYVMYKCNGQSIPDGIIAAAKSIPLLRQLIIDCGKSLEPSKDLQEENAKVKENTMKFADLLGVNENDTVLNDAFQSQTGNFLVQPTQKPPVVKTVVKSASNSSTGKKAPPPPKK